ncbi:DEP domain-containing mTOR-interacting protein-like isoform X3 [Chiloscyllium plagiosum]|uniref:DEP domain-containing mTOR-interacting protein-like isoform X3 n=1 Tax=Chiloscyllium plagiosum TaxID=36176 RepID=UPI001CB85CBD|nr:DEP domain-containing mTOR-interacting protein-like isoform X3 [Chiloscyllium plagiosum]
MESLQNSVKKKATERHYKAEVLITGEQLRLRLHDGKLIKDRRYNLRTYPNCFVAKELIDWLIDHKEAPDRETAIKLMQKLMDHNIIHHVCDGHSDFKDAKLLYRFRKDDGTFPLSKEVKVFMRGQSLYEKLISSEDAIMKLQEENGLKYQRAVLGCEIIDWLIKEGEASSRKEAVELCRRELEHGIIQHGNTLFISTLSRLLRNLHDSFKSPLTFQNFSGCKPSLSNLFPSDNIPITVSNRHHFFDSNLLYQFRLNFRRRRRLTELLSEDLGTPQESHDSPFCLRKLNPEQDGSSFLSVQTNKEIKVVSAVRRSSITSAVTGSTTFYNTAPSLACLPSVECNPKSGQTVCCLCEQQACHEFGLQNSQQHYHDWTPHSSDGSYGSN